MQAETSMQAETIDWYRSKIDWWLAVLLCVPPVAAVAVSTNLLMQGKYAELMVGALAALIVFGIYFGLVFPMRYGLDGTYLTVRFGQCRQQIPLADIREVYPTHNPLSSPALSLDRLYIQFGDGMFKAVMISPADRERFLNELADRAGLQREGDRLQRIG